MADEGAERLPLWVFGALLCFGLVGLFFLVLDPLHLVPDDNSALLVGAWTSAVVGLLGPTAVKRL